MNYEIIKISKKYIKERIVNLIFMTILLIMPIIIFKISSTSFLFIVILLELYGVIATTISIFKVNMKIKITSSEELKTINKELENCILIRNDCILTQNYIIVGGNNNFDIIKYKDITMIYTKYQLMRNRIEKTLCLLTNTKQKYRFVIGTTLLSEKSDTKDFSSILIEKNPNILTK